MPVLNLKNACVLLRQEYYKLSCAQKTEKHQEAFHANNEIDKIRTAFQKLIPQKQPIEQEVILTNIEFSLITWENELMISPTKKELLAYKAQLKGVEKTDINTAAMTNSKWKQAELTVKDVIKNLSGASKKSTKDAIRKENLYQKINEYLRKLEEKNAKDQQDILEKLKGTFSSPKPDLNAILQLIVLFYRESGPLVKGVRDNSVDGCVEALKFLLKILTVEELKRWFKQMQSNAVISLMNALYTQNYFINNSRNEQEMRDNKNGAFNDMFELLSVGTDSMKEKMQEYCAKNKDNLKQSPVNIDLESGESFLVGVTHIHSIFSRFYVSLEEEIEARTHKKVRVSSQILADWPAKDGEFVKVPVSDLEKQCIVNAVKELYAEKKPKQDPVLKDVLFTISLSDNPKRGENCSPKLVQYFGELAKAFGSWFNPNKFIDALHVFHNDPFSANDKITQMDDKALNKLYKNLKGEDLNSLVSLLRQIKEGDQKSLMELCQWLSIERTAAVKFNEKFQALAENWYDSANHLMQMVRKEVNARKLDPQKMQYTRLQESELLGDSEHTEDYPYNDLTLLEKRARTPKNAACMKQLLNAFYTNDDSNKPEYKVKLTLWDKLYHWMYPSPKKIEIESPINAPSVNEKTLKSPKSVTDIEEIFKEAITGVN